jgi:hypothetical protein
VDAAEAMPWLRDQGGTADQGGSMQMFGWELDSPASDLSSDDASATPLPWMAEPSASPSRASQPAEDDLLGDLFADLGAGDPSMPPAAAARPSTSSFDAPTKHDAPRRTLPKSAPLPPPASTSVPSPSAPSPLDDWFATMGVEAGSPDAAGSAADAPASEDYMPDWLLAGQVPTSQPAMPSQPDFDVDALASLFDSSADALNAKPGSRDANKTGPMPDSPPPTPAAPDSAEEEVPAWLRGMDVNAPANRTPISMPATPSATRPPTNVPPVNPSAASGPDFGWLDNLDASTPADLSESAARQAAELDWMATPAAGGLASNQPSAALPADDSTASVELDIDALLKSGTPSIDNLLSMSEIRRPPAPVTDPSAMPAPEFDSGLFDPTPPMSTTSSMALSASKMSRPKKETPKDDLDSLFADAVLDDNVFDRSEAALKDLQKVELQGETSMLDKGADFGATGVLTPPSELATSDAEAAPSSTTKLLSRKDSLRPPPAQSAPPPNALRGFDAPGEVLPEWVADLRPAEAPVTLNIGDQVIKMKEDPISQLPDQIRTLRERAKEYRVVETKQSAPLEGPLAGITGAITPIAPQSMTAAPSASIAKRMGTGADALSERVKMLQSLLNLEQEVSERRKLEEAQREAAEADEAGIAIKAPPRQRLSIKVDRLLITFLLLAALIMPFVLRATAILPTLDAVAARADASDGRYKRLSEALNQLQPGQAVLLAFEYTPTAAAEMDEIARMLLIDLFGRGVRPVMVSTNPTGVLRAYDLVDRLSRDADISSLLKRTEPLVNREDYYVLRYLSGGLVGLRTLVNALYSPGLDALFLTDLDGQTTNIGPEVVEQLRTSPALVLAEGADDVREWAEQYRVTGVNAPASAAPAQAGQLRLALFTAASASAIAESYAVSSAGRITSVLVGVRDAAIYRRLNGLEGSAEVARSADERWQSLQLGLLLASFIMLFGMILNAMRGLLRRRGAR